MRKKRLIATFIALVLLVAGWIAGVQIAGAESRDRLVDKYAALAGSDRNASILVNGLRSGSDFTLSGTHFRTPTGQMESGAVDIALALAEARFRSSGIASPSAELLKAALIGDLAHPGILLLRAEGRGWGQIANAMGIRLDDTLAQKSERRNR